MDDLTNFFLNQYPHILSSSRSALVPEKIVEDIVAYYENIIACMPGNVYWLDKNCVTLGANNNVLTMFGIKDLSAFKGLTFEEMGKLGKWSHKAVVSFKKDTLDVINSGKAKINIEEPPIPDASGRLIHFLSSRVPLYNKLGEIIGVVGISVDITDRKRLEASLVEAKEKAESANKAKTEFLENMRHDIRTPLVGIEGFAKIIRDEVREPKIKEYADNLVASSEALLELLNEILEVIRVSSGDIPLLKKKFDFQKRLRSVVDLNQAKAHHKNIKLTFDYDKRLPLYVLGDCTRIHRIVLELMSNALNFTKKGSVALKAELAKAQDNDLVVKISVKDTGIGMEPRKQEEVFLQFKRLTPSYEGIYKGAGLGLSIVKQFVDELQGEIYVHSTLGAGTEFTCILPLKKALLDEAFGAEDVEGNGLSITPLAQSTPHTTTKRKTSSTKSTSGQNHILVVEDNFMAARVVETILTSLECIVDIAENGESAVTLAKQNQYDLIFMDIGLPKMNGYQATQLIRQQESQQNTEDDYHVPIIALTAHVDEESKQHCIEVGMNAVLSKPLAPEKAEDILDAFIPGRAKKTNTTKITTPKKQKAAQPELKEKKEKPVLPPITGKVLDMALATKQVGGKPAFAHEVVTMLVRAFPEQLEQLKAAHEKQAWSAIQDIVHKLKGGSGYCGVVRLGQVCAALEGAIRKPEPSLREPLFQLLLKEIHAIQKAYKPKKAELH